MSKSMVPMFAMVPEAGEFKFTWYDDDGSV